MDLVLLLPVSLFAGFLPMICWAIIIWWLDRYEKEPFPLLLLSFLWGMAPAIIFSLIFEVILRIPVHQISGQSSLGLEFIDAGALAPIIEEGIKILGLIGIFWVARMEIDGPLDGIIYAAMVGFGFAATENSFYFLNSVNIPEFLLLVFLRAMIFGSTHAMFTAFSGLGLVLAKYSKQRSIAAAWMIAGFSLAVIFHMLFNAGWQWASTSIWAFLLSIISNLIGIILIIALFFGSLLREKRIVRKYLHRYAQEGMISLEQWQTAGSVLDRLRMEWSALRRMDYHGYRQISSFYTLCAELAFKEKQRKMTKVDPSLEERLKDLQKRVSQLAARLDDPSPSALV